MNIEIKTKFEIDDSVYGFTDGKLHNLRIDRIEINLARYGSSNPVNNYEVCYLTTVMDDKSTYQCRFRECSLFTEDELKKYINNYFNKSKESNL
jgi:hypothetical protein